MIKTQSVNDFKNKLDTFWTEAGYMDITRGKLPIKFLN